MPPSQALGPQESCIVAFWLIFFCVTNDTSWWGVEQVINIHARTKITFDFDAFISDHCIHSLA